MVFEKTCCHCQHLESEQELCQDRLDVDIVFYCLKTGDYLFKDCGRNSDCQLFELHDELKNSMKYQLEQLQFALKKNFNYLIKWLGRFP